MTSHSLLLKICLELSGSTPAWPFGTLSWDVSKRSWWTIPHSMEVTRDVSYIPLLHWPFTEGHCFLIRGHLEMNTLLLLSKCRGFRLHLAAVGAHASFTAMPGICISGCHRLSDLGLRFPDAPQEEEEKELRWDSWALNGRFSHPYLWSPT